MRYFSERPDKGKQVSSYDLDLCEEINEFAAQIIYNHSSAFKKSCR